MSTRQAEWARERSLGCVRVETIARIDAERERLSALIGVNVAKAALIDALLNEALDARKAGAR